MQLCSSLGGDDYNGRRNGTGGEGEIHAWSSDRIDDDGRVRKQGSKSQAQTVRMGEGIRGKESVRTVEAVRSRQRSDERSNSSSEVLLCEFDNLGRLANSLLPEEHDRGRLLGGGR
jgi:hypothetical protein